MVLSALFQPRSLSLRAGESISDERLSLFVCLVQDGWVLSSFSDREGLRQVTGVLMARDTRWPTPVEDAAEVTALTPAVIDLIPLSHLHEAARHQGAQVLTAAYHDAQRLLLDQVRLLSARSGRGKIERLIETLSRRALASAASAPDGSVSLPLTRPVLADTLGMTERHVSRVLKDMEREGLIRLRRGVIHAITAACPA